jgi:PAS domain S-box-containing protein
VVASYAALDLAGRVTASRGRIRLIWLTGGAASMGMGIWSMHYIGMLAYNLPVPVYYDRLTVLWSLLAAMLASAIALFVVSRNRMGLWPIGIGGVLMGCGIAAMHYIGMAAMRLPAMCQYDSGLVELSVVLAVEISLVALWLAFHLRRETNSMSWRKLVSATVMGLAIPVMHYTGMAAASFHYSPAPVDLANSLEISALGTLGIGGVAFMVLFLAIVTSMVDRRFSAQALELQQSEQRYRQLVDSAKVILWSAGSNCHTFSYVNREAEDLLGYPIHDWTHQPNFWVDHLHPDDRLLVESHCRTAAEDGAAHRFEHRMVARDGRVIWLRTSVRLVSEEGQCNEIAGVMTDITDRKLAQEAAEQASLAKSELLAEISSLHDRLKEENLRIGAELEVTRRLQQMMLPREEEMSKIDGLDISGSMQPAAEVGGDYYDVIHCQDGGVVCVIGDVTGHGLESGVIAIMVQTAVRTLLASEAYESKKLLNVLNSIIYESVQRMRCDRNLTLSLLRYRDKVVTISGQHEEVLVVRRNGDLERYDTLDLGFPLGLEQDISRFIGEGRFLLQSGDVMVAYTDGITEATNRANVPFGVERICEILKRSHGKPAHAVREAVLCSLREHIGDQALLDDISLLVVKPS